mmetsp:Transcript_6718/g.9402  ORF Transcript_6718/g.9402 Transcript_6718/m.9402 type:complete len:129 (-) Transcript_6718:246-632(-)
MLKIGWQRLLVSTNRSLNRTFRTTAVVMGGDHTPPPKPPMLSYQPPNYRIYEQTDAVWDDGVAAELALDFDCPNISSYQALLMLIGGGFGFFGLTYYLVSLTKPEELNPAKPRTVRVDAVGNPIDEEE